MNEVDKIEDETLRKNLINSMNENMQKITKIYKSMELFDFLESFGLIAFVKIYENTTKHFVYYSREFLNNFLKNGQKKNIINDHIIQVNHDNVELFLKYEKPLPGSHNLVLEMISEESNDSSNEYYLTNISQSDISNLFK